MGKLYLGVLGTITIMSIFTFMATAQVKEPGFAVALKFMLSSKTPTINIQDAAAHQSDYTFLDSREKAEYDVSHIKNATYIGDKDFDLNRVAGIAKNTPIVIYCSVGKRSENATNALLKAGFTNVKNMYGGIFEWVNRGNKVYDNSGKETNRVHTYNKFWGQWMHNGVKVY